MPPLHGVRAGGGRTGRKPEKLSSICHEGLGRPTCPHPVPPRSLPAASRHRREKPRSEATAARFGLGGDGVAGPAVESGDGSPHSINIAYPRRCKSHETNTSTLPGQLGAISLSPAPDPAILLSCPLKRKLGPPPPSSASPSPSSPGAGGGLAAKPAVAVAAAAPPNPRTSAQHTPPSNSSLDFVWTPAALGLRRKSPLCVWCIDSATRAVARRRVRPRGSSAGRRAGIVFGGPPPACTIPLQPRPPKRISSASPDKFPRRNQRDARLAQW